MMNKSTMIRVAAVSAATGVMAMATWAMRSETEVQADVPVRVVPAVAAGKDVPVREAAFAATGTLKGKVTLDGKAPAPKMVVKKGGPNPDVKPEDKAVCEAEDIPDETLVVGADGGIANVFIYLGRPPAGYKHTPPDEPVVFDQKGCKFFPHGMVVQVGQTVLVKSQDAIAHNTRTTVTRSRPFNQSIKPNESEGVKLVYDRAERVPVEVKCDYHKWMKAYHLVQDHPFIAVTDEKGEYEIKDLPAGKHEFVIWHEMKGWLNRKQEVTIKGGENVLNLKYKLSELGG
jgi:plastocyanin